MLSNGVILLLLYLLNKMVEPRKSYSLHFKNNDLKKLKENGGKVSQTSVECGVQRKNIQRWMPQEGLSKKSIQNRHVNSRERRKVDTEKLPTLC